jgi:hypothetical protein
MAEVACVQRGTWPGSGDEVDGELEKVKEGMASKVGKDSRYNMSEGRAP